ncbi:MAG: 4-hydroxy-tetrahydrodipicolinate synthase [candidate division WOR-3 bacterium]
MFQGVFTAIVTPFNEDGSVCEEDLKRLVDFNIENGVTGIVPMGTTGESPTLSHEEHLRVIEVVCEHVNGRVPIIAGTGSNSTKEALYMTSKAKELGANASLQVAPYYNKPTQEGLYRHFKTIADEVDLPMFIYNIPGRTGVNIEPNTIAKLAEHPNIIGVKEASGSLPQMMDIIKNTPPEFIVLSGDDNLTLPLMAVGGKGVISVASNIVPDKMSKMVKAGLEGNFEEMRKLHYELLPLFKAEFIETNPIPIKTALAMKGMIKEVFRLPLCEMSAANKSKLKEVLINLGII